MKPLGWGRLLYRAIREHPGRSAVSAASVALGVALFLAVSAGTRAVSDALDRDAAFTLPGIPEDAVVLQPSGVFGAETPGRSVEAIREVPGVRSVLVTYEVLLSVEVENIHAQVTAYGSEPPAMARAPLIAGRLPNPGENEIVVAEGFFGVAVVGKSATVVAPSGEFEAVVSGVTRVGPGAEFGTLTSLETARRWAGVDDGVSFAVVELLDGTDVADWIEEHRRDLGALQPSPNLLLESDAAEFFRTIEDALAPVASAALLIGGYLIFLSVSRTVQDRRRVHATLRALGASRRQLIGLVVAETGIAGVGGTVVGVAFGLVMARGVARAMGTGFDVPLTADPSVSASPLTLAIGVLLGLVTPLVASALPALSAARADPVTGLRETSDEASSSRRSAGVGVVAFILGLGLTAGLAEVLKPLGVVVAMVGVILLAPQGARAMGAVARRVWAMASPVSGELAARRLARRPGRSASTAGLLAVCLALVFLVATLRASARPGFQEIVSTQLGADLVVADYSNRGLAPEVVEAVTNQPAVARVSQGAAGWVVLLDRGGRTEFMTVVDPGAYFEVSDFAWAVGTDPAIARGRLGRGGHVLLEQSIADRVHKEVGDTVTVQTVNGPMGFTVAGTYAGLAFGNSRAVVVSVADARRHLGYLHPSRLAVRLEPGADPAAVQADLYDFAPGELGDRPFFVERNDVFRNDVMDAFNGAWGGVVVVMVTTVLVALLGLANTLVMEVMGRRHELGVMRAIGATRREVAGVVVIEALTLSITAGVLGVFAGTAVGRAAVERLTLDTGVAQPFHFPAGVVAPVIGGAIVVGVLASLVAARRSTHLDPADVLRCPST